jgi:hypothetical protein
MTCASSAFSFSRRALASSSTAGAAATSASFFRAYQGVSCERSKKRPGRRTSRSKNRCLLLFFLPPFTSPAKSSAVVASLSRRYSPANPPCCFFLGEVAISPGTSTGAACCAAGILSAETGEAPGGLIIFCLASIPSTSANSSAGAMDECTDGMGSVEDPLGLVAGDAECGERRFLRARRLLPGMMDRG